MKCKFCQKEVAEGWEADDRFCSVDCAQADYEDEVLQEELKSDNPIMEGLDEALERLA